MVFFLTTKLVCLSSLCFLEFISILQLLGVTILKCKSESGLTQAFFC